MILKWKKFHLNLQNQKNLIRFDFLFFLQLVTCTLSAFIFRLSNNLNFKKALRPVIH
jgi:hypothetical protein